MPAPRSLSVRPVAMVLAAILSVQVGAAFSKGLFDVVSPTGMVWLRLATSTLVLLLLARPKVTGRSRGDWTVVLAFQDLRLIDLRRRGLFGAFTLDNFVAVFGSPGFWTALRTTLLFSVAGHTGPQVHESLAARGVNAPAGSFYAIEASRHLGLGDAGAVRVGLAPYTSESDVDRLLDGLAALA